MRPNTGILSRLRFLDLSGILEGGMIGFDGRGLIIKLKQCTNLLKKGIFVSLKKDSKRYSRVYLCDVN